MKGYDYYARFRPTRAGERLQALRSENQWTTARRYLPAGGRVLEIGPGYGSFARAVRAAGHAYLAVEANGLLAARMAKDGYRTCAAQAPPLPLAPGSVDLVYASHVIEHMPGPDAALAFVRETHRVLRRGGLLVLCAPDYLAFGGLFWDCDYTHAFPVTKRRLQQLLVDGEFEVLRAWYSTGPWSGPLAPLLGRGARLLPVGVPLVPETVRFRLSQLRLTFLRNVCAIARVAGGPRAGAVAADRREGAS